MYIMKRDENRAEKSERMRQYADHVHHRGLRRYAQAYASWLVSDAKDDEPREPMNEPRVTPGGCASIRNRLHLIWEE
jgi:hypothetical protein